MNVVLVTGGSGGHLVPAMTLAQNLIRQGTCTIVSCSRPADQVLRANFSGRWEVCDVEQFTPWTRWFSIRYLCRQWRGFRKIRSLFREIRPDVVVGFGGYVSAFGIAAARLSGIRTVIHEQNFLPGKANRWLAPWVDAVAVSFSETQNYLGTKAFVRVTGNPVRQSMTGQMGRQEARAALHLDPDRPVLLVMGGSQGSVALNRLATAMWASSDPVSRAQFQVIHLTGSGPEQEKVQAAYRVWGVRTHVEAFSNRMPELLAAATLTICRAGATTIAEITRAGLPAILVPYPHAGGHQRANARWVEQRGGGQVVEEAGLTGERLWQMTESLLKDSGRLNTMRSALGRVGEEVPETALADLVRWVTADEKEKI